MPGKEKSRAGSEEQNHSLFDVGQTESLTRRTRPNERIYISAVATAQLAEGTLERKAHKCSNRRSASDTRGYPMDGPRLHQRSKTKDRTR